MTSDRSFDAISFGERVPGVRYGAAVALAILIHVVVFWVLAGSLLFRLPEEPKVEPKIVAVAPRIVPPPPNVSKLAPSDIVTVLPRFRPRIPAVVPQRREGDPALAVWTYLCSRDYSLSVATQRACPEFNFGSVALGTLDPLNRNGDVGALMGPDTATMSLDEIGRKKGWFKPKTPWPAEGARAKGDSLGLPGHDPFAILPK